MNAPGAHTRVFAVLGDPVEHSLSPRMHNAALRASGLDGVYVALRVASEAVAGMVRGLAGAGGGGNVTLPHKTRALAGVDDVTEAARRTGACNTFWGEGGRVWGDNTDVEGFRRALDAFRPPSGQRVTLVGAGGAARAVALALLDAGADRVDVVNRTRSRAEALVDALHDARLHAPERAEPGADLLVNATRLGLEPSDPLPADLEAERPSAVFDLVYATRDTPIVAAARRAGLPACDGREMLVLQGAAAFERWWGRPAPVEVMREALEG